jgi:hypothetical protein
MWQRPKSLTDQALWRNSSDLLTKLSTENGGKAECNFAIGDASKLRIGKYSLWIKGLAAKRRTCPQSCPQNVCKAAGEPAFFGDLSTACFLRINKISFKNKALGQCPVACSQSCPQNVCRRVTLVHRTPFGWRKQRGRSRFPGFAENLHRIKIPFEIKVLAIGQSACSQTYPQKMWGNAQAGYPSCMPHF